MSQYLVLSKVTLQNANSIAGLTWGFPAITQFLGFTHALSRQISAKYNIELSGCMVIANDVTNKVYQPKPYADFEFLQSKNPPVLAKHKSDPPPIIEEGKLNATISLVIEIARPLLLNTDQIAEFEKYIQECCFKMRLAGGSVLNIDLVRFFSANDDKSEEKQLNQIKRLCMPGFVLQDQSRKLAQRTEQFIAENHSQPHLAAWLDFAALKAVAKPRLTENQHAPDEQTEADWEYVKGEGYLVPVMTGYKAIAKPLRKDEVQGLRVKPDPDDADVKKVSFVEAVHSVAEWKSMHKVSNISDCIWRYHHEGEWYLCQQQRSQTAEITNYEFSIDEF